MFLYPKDIKDKLEFNKFTDHISAECFLTLVVELLRKERIGRDYR